MVTPHSIPFIQRKDVKVCATFHGHLSKSVLFFFDVTLKTTYVTGGAATSHLDSSSEDHECQHKISWLSIDIF